MRSEEGVGERRGKTEGEREGEKEREGECEKGEGHGSTSVASATMAARERAGSVRAQWTSATMAA